MAKGKVEVVKDSRATVLSAAGKIFRVPAVLRLIKLIRTIYRAGVAFTKRNVLVRDGFRCAYCGSQETGFRLITSYQIPRRENHL